MGKQLRNRQIQDETDEQLDCQDDQKSIISQISKSQLRHIISKRFSVQPSVSDGRAARFAKRVQTRQIEQIVDVSQLECSICLELMVAPTMMQCGHMYCYKCLESSSAHSQRCCLCRQEQQTFPRLPCHLAETLINQYQFSQFRIVLPSSTNIIKYLCRTTDAQEWAKRRRVNNIRVGVVLDFQDRYNTWRRGVVIKTFMSNDKKIMLEIRISIKGQEFFEQIEADSRRLAPFTFFTRGRYLQEFAPILPEYDPVENELLLLEYKKERQYDDFFGNFASENEIENLELIENFPSQNLDGALQLFNFEMEQVDSIFF